MVGLIFAVIILIPLPLTMIICGVWFIKSPPDMNSGIGYRTERSLSSAEAWLAAHRICGRLWLISGSVTLIITLLCGALALALETEVGSEIYNIILIIEGIQLALLIGAVPVTESRLKRIFHI